MNSEKYIGLDVHQATIVVAVTDSSGKLIMESILTIHSIPSFLGTATWLLGQPIILSRWCTRYFKNSGAYQRISWLKRPFLPLLLPGGRGTQTGRGDVAA